MLAMFVDGKNLLQFNVFKRKTITKGENSYISQYTVNCSIQCNKCIMILIFTVRKIKL